MKKMNRVNEGSKASQSDDGNKNEGDDNEIPRIPPLNGDRQENANYHPQPVSTFYFVGNYCTLPPISIK
jgi:hypothetical protein